MDVIFHMSWCLGCLRVALSAFLHKREQQARQVGVAEVGQLNGGCPGGRGSVSVPGSSDFEVRARFFSESRHRGRNGVDIYDTAEHKSH